MNIYDKNHPHNALYLQCCAAAMRGSTVNKDWLAAGICHLTREAAQAQWDAFYGVQK